MLPEFETNPLTVKILNLINQAKPVAITPKYNKIKLKLKLDWNSKEFR